MARLKLLAVALDQTLRAWDVRHHLTIDTPAQDSHRRSQAFAHRSFQPKAHLFTGSPSLLPRPMGSDDLKVHLLVENGGASPLEAEQSLGMGWQEAKAVFRRLVHHSLLGWQSRPHAKGGLPWPWSFGSTNFQLTPLACSLCGDEDVTDRALTASPLLLLLKEKP